MDLDYSLKNLKKDHKLNNLVMIVICEFYILRMGRE
jgi:hypothetical protein